MSDQPEDDCPQELDAALDEVDHLKLALTSSRHIGAAIGIVMAGRRCTEQQAFDLIRGHSQRVQIKVGVLAERLIATGDVSAYLMSADAAKTELP